MAKAQVKVITRFGSWDDPDSGEVIIFIDLLPRGSGNRNTARRLAREFKAHPLLGPHILRVKSGSSRVTIAMRPTLEAMRAVLDVQAQGRQLLAEEKSGQLKLAF